MFIEGTSASESALPALPFSVLYALTLIVLGMKSPGVSGSMLFSTKFGGLFGVGRLCV